MTENPLWAKYESNIQNEGLTALRQSKLKLMFDITSRHINFNTATRENIERFIDNLHKNKIRRDNGDPYSASTISDLKKFLKQFYKWFKGKGEAYPPEVSWIRTRIAKDQKPKEKDTVTIDELQKIANLFNKTEHRIMTLLLFDSGFRISELMSVRKQDLAWKEYEKNEKCFWLNCTDSKTFTRNIPVPLFTEELKLFVNTGYYMEKKDDDLLFPRPESYAQLLKVWGKKVTKTKNITPHSLRHSSATYWANRIKDHTQLCIRFGWSIGSDEAKTYIRRAGIQQTVAAKVVFEDEISDIRKQNEALTQKINNLEKQLEPLQTFFDSAEVQRLFKEHFKRKIRAK